MRNNIKINTIIVWLLVAVFAFTSVFNTSVVYSGTETAIKNQDELLPTEHSWSDWILMNEDKTSAELQYERVCSECGEVERKTEINPAFTDTQAPMVSDIYFTVDGVKANEKGFVVNDGQIVKLFVDANDSNGVGIATVEVQLGVVNESVYGQEGDTIYLVLEYDEKKGIYSTIVNLDLSYYKWFVDIIRVCDSFGNEKVYSELNGMYLYDMYFFNDDAKLYSYVVSFNTYEDYINEEVTSKKYTSLNDWNIEIPKCSIDGTDFIGWRINDSEIIIKDKNQTFEISGGNLSLTAVYSKRIIKIDAHYQNKNGNDEMKSFLLGIDNNATYGQVKDIIINGGYLENIIHDTSVQFVGWHNDYDGTPNEVIDEGIDFFNLFAGYVEIDKPVIGEDWASSPENVCLKYYWQSMVYTQPVELGTASKVTLPYSYNKTKPVIIEWSDVDGAWCETAVEWVDDQVGTATLDSVNGTDYVVQVQVAEPASNTDCSIRINAGSKRYRVDTATAKVENGGATITVADLNDLSLQVFTKGYAFVDNDMEFVNDPISAYYIRNLTDIKNGETNITFTLTAEDGTKQTYKIRVLHDHSWSDWIVTTAATCTVAGSQYKECGCGEKTTDSINALGHDMVQYAAKASTCIEKGYDAYEMCKRCNYTTYKETPAKGHDYKPIITSATCEKEGYTTYRCSCGDSYVTDYVGLLGHEWEFYITVKVPSCTELGLDKERCNRCNELRNVETVATGHTAGPEADCTTSQQCVICGTELAVAKGHVWSETYTVSKAATTKEAGSKAIHCTACTTVKPGTIVTIAKIKNTTANNLVYNGINRTTNVSAANVKGKKLVKGKDFIVTYKNSKGTKVVTPKAVGTYRAIVKFVGDYSGSVTKTFKINPQGTKIIKLTNPTKKQIKVSWSKQAVQTTGYQIRYSTKQNMSNASTVLVAKSGTTTRVIKQLKAKKKYWVQIRTYKTVNGVKHFSAWSGKKTIVTK